MANGRPLLSANRHDRAWPFSDFAVKGLDRRTTLHLTARVFPLFAIGSSASPSAILADIAAVATRRNSALARQLRVCVDAGLRSPAARDGAWHFVEKLIQIARDIEDFLHAPLLPHVVLHAGHLVEQVLP